MSEQERMTKLEIVTYLMRHGQVIALFRTSSPQDNSPDS